MFKYFICYTANNHSGRICNYNCTYATKRKIIDYSHIKKIQKYISKEFKFIKNDTMVINNIQLMGQSKRR